MLAHLLIFCLFSRACGLFFLDLFLFFLSFFEKSQKEKRGKISEKDRAKEAKENILISVSTSIFIFFFLNRGSDVEVDSRKKGSNLSYVVMSDMF